VPKLWIGARPIAASVLALAVVGACVTVSGPAATSPVATLPPIPTVAVPSITIPTIAVPSIAVPSLAAPSIAPSIVAPSIVPPSLVAPSIVAPSLGAGGDCPILSTAAANAATGIAWTFAGSDATSCTFVDATFSTANSTFNIRKGTGETIATARVIDTAGKDLTIAGHPAFWGPLFHQLYVDLGGDTLVILIPTTDDAAGFDLAQKLANAYFAQ
jgi:hypothetical protein